MSITGAVAELNKEIERLTNIRDSFAGRISPRYSEHCDCSSKEDRPKEEIRSQEGGS
jgi:hypothetical protein